MKKLLSIVLASTFLLGSSAALADTYKVEYNTGAAYYEDLSPVKVTFNGAPLDASKPSVVKDSRSLVPVRVLAESIGATVDWDAATSNITIAKDGNTVVLQIGNPTAYVNGVATPLIDNIAPMIVNENTVVPLRFVNENLGLNVDWDGPNYTAVITTPDYVAPLADDTVAVAEPGTTYTYYNMTFEQMVQAQAAKPLVTINYGGGWGRASVDEIRKYLDVSSITPDSELYFQFLDLSKSSGIPAAQFNNVLAGKGILDGLGDAFVQGGATYGVNEAYLVAHAFLETGYGTSRLATGVQYNGRTVYNMFGIGAIDSDPIGGGARTAYENGWFTPYDAVVGGAKFVSEKYINRAGNNQNTIYEMRWNPDMNQLWHQYATDVRWANAQVRNIKNIYDQCPNHVLNFDIPVYQ